MYKAVFLDAGNTLFHTTLPRRDRIVDALERRGWQASPEEVEVVMEKVRTEMWDSPLWPLQTPEREDEWWLEYYQRLLNHLDEDIDEAGDLAQEVLYVNHVRIFDDVKEVLDTLQDRVELGVISNAFPSLGEALDDLGLTGYFDTIVNSSLVDCWKPDTRIYEIALNRLEVQAQDAVFVDDLEENVAAAEDLGITALLIDRWEEYPDSPHRRITDLYPVVEMVADS